MERASQGWKDLPFPREDDLVLCRPASVLLAWRSLIAGHSSLALHPSLPLALTAALAPELLL